VPWPEWPLAGDLLVTYSNRSDLREQLQRVAVILPEGASHDEGPDSNSPPGHR
jgi:hypothetical protein